MKINLIGTSIIGLTKQVLVNIKIINNSWGILHYNFMAPSFVVTTFDTTNNTPSKILPKIIMKIKDYKL